MSNYFKIFSECLSSQKTFEWESRKPQTEDTNGFLSVFEYSSINCGTEVSFGVFRKIWRKALMSEDKTVVHNSYAVRRLFCCQQFLKSIGVLCKTCETKSKWLRNCWLQLICDDSGVGPLRGQIALFAPNILKLSLCFESHLRHSLRKRYDFILIRNMISNLMAISCRTNPNKTMDLLKDLEPIGTDWMRMKWIDVTIIVYLLNSKQNGIPKIF